MNIDQSYRTVRILLTFFMLGLLASGLTAFPLTSGVNVLVKFAGKGSPVENIWPEMANWISWVHQGINETNNRYPFMFYGTDWLAFAHIMIAIFFIGPLRDPLKNIWVIEAGMMACILVIPLALICGPLRGIPCFWVLIDCSFGVFGILPLAAAYRYTKRIMLFEQKKMAAE